MTIKPTLQTTLDELGITRNKLSVESKVRPATLQTLVDGKASLMKFDTLKALLDAINEIAAKQGSTKIYRIDDVITYESIREV
jgi:predicted transcriptional regulator